MKFPEQSHWTNDLLVEVDAEIAKVAAKYKLDTYPNVFEIITSEQMMDAYSSVGLPTYYNHWSFGKHFIETEHDYVNAKSGLAYEIVINSNPCISYLMEENSLTMQALVIAHAAYGHNSFFKGNYMFRDWTEASEIVDYMIYAKKFITDCEERYGVDRVEKLLDSCHAIQNYAVYRYKRPPALTRKQKEARDLERREYEQSQVNELWKTIPQKDEKRTDSNENVDEENILMFIAENSPAREPWEKQIMKIICHISQYFYPQRQTQVMNEGWATFWHYTILNDLYDNGTVNDAFMLEFLDSHAGVTYQHPFSKINPYALGFEMMRDIRRICEKPTDEDKEWFPDIAGTDWVSTLDNVMRNYRDESFIRQFLSPRLIREFKLVNLKDEVSQPNMVISDVHDDEGLRTIRNNLANNYDLGQNEPDIRIVSASLKDDRTLVLKHTVCRNRELNSHIGAVQEHIKKLWGYKIQLHTISNGVNFVRSA